MLKFQNKIINGDCLKELKKIPDNSFDLVFADPPYNMQIGDWKQAEKDFLDSLKVKPNQAYVINYLAYSWIEKGINIEKSLKMLEEANRLRSNDGYITDSLGWALYKLKKYNKAKEYLKKAVQLMPSDPIVNDHFGDILWMNGDKLQARYYWKYVLNLENAEDDLKDEIMKKILNGPA